MHCRIGWLLYPIYTLFIDYAPGFFYSILCMSQGLSCGTEVPESPPYICRDTVLGKTLHEFDPGHCSKHIGHSFLGSQSMNYLVGARKILVSLSTRRLSPFLCGPVSTMATSAGTFGPCPSFPHPSENECLLTNNANLQSKSSVQWWYQAHLEPGNQLSSRNCSLSSRIPLDFQFRVRFTPPSSKSPNPPETPSQKTN